MVNLWKKPKSNEEYKIYDDWKIPKGKLKISKSDILIYKFYSVLIKSKWFVTR